MIERCSSYQEHALKFPQVITFLIEKIDAQSSKSKFIIFFKYVDSSSFHLSHRPFHDHTRAIKVLLCFEIFEYILRTPECTRLAFVSFSC